MNITIDTTAQTIRLNEPATGEELLEFIRRNAYWRWTVIWYKKKRLIKVKQ